MRPNVTALIAAALIVTGPIAGCAADGASGTPSPAPDSTTTAPPPTTISSAAPATPTADQFPDQPLIDHATWTATDRGRQLQVFPTPAGRADRFRDAWQRAWDEVRAAAPDADTPGMLDQFLCHWDWARVIDPAKPSWNLEPWRPAVGYQATVDAACNPGGPES